MLDQTVTADADDLAQGTWLVDPQAGHIAFAVKSMWGMVDVKGTFDRFEGALHVTDTGSRGELVVHTDSLDTKNKKRDDHLRGADFFDARSHPRVTFSSTSLISEPGGTVLSGDLTVGGTRTHLDIPVRIRPVGETAAVVLATLQLPRERVGLVWNKAGMIKGDARLDIELRLVASA